MADMKGDLSGISQVGKLSGFIEKRLPEFGLEAPEFQSCPVRFFDVFGEQGHPMRSTVSGMGPQLLARLLELNETQSGILNIVFRIADDRGLLLIDIKDLRSMLDYVATNAAQYKSTYGNITTASVGTIQRALLALESQGSNILQGIVMDGSGTALLVASGSKVMQFALSTAFDLSTATKVSEKTFDAAFTSMLVLNGGSTLFGMAANGMAYEYNLTA